MYEPVENFTTSDHKPIRGAFSLRLNEPLMWRSAAPLVDSMDSKDSTGRSLDKEYGRDETEVHSQQDFVKRETMHIVVSSIQCIIHPDEYDKLRKVEKAELPNPFLCFVSTPPEAVQLDDGLSKKGLWSKFRFGGKNKKSKEDGRSKNDTIGTGKKFPSSISRLSDRYPCTTVVEATMRPNWQKENLHFTIRTHLSTGAPIDLTGALLHITLFDAKGPTIVGSFALNLCHLITMSRHHPKRATKQNVGQVASPRRGLQGPSGRTSGEETNPRPESTLLSPSGRAHRNSSSRAREGIVQGHKSKILSPRKARNFGDGPSKSLRSLIVEETNGSDGNGSEILQDFQIVSLHLDESLVDCGVEVGRIKCSLDVWWMKEDPLIAAQILEGAVGSGYQNHKHKEP
jgi:hypothetical protein